MNLLIGDNFFKQNPSKILGVQSTRSGRYGNDVIVVEGSLSDIDKIDASPVAVVDLMPEQALTTKTEAAIIEKVFQTEEKASTQKKVKELREKKTSTTPAKNTKDVDVYSFAEIDQLYNQGISRDEKEAYYITHPELNYKLLFDKFTNTIEQLVGKKLVCWDVEEQKYVYYVSYQSGNVGKKISALQREKEKFVSKMGAVQYDVQMNMLVASKPKAKGLVGDDKITILPHSNFAKDFDITELRYSELHGKMNLISAFRQWLYRLPADNFEKTTSYEVIQYYLENKSIAISKNNKEQQVKDEKNAINIRQRTKEEGDKLFARFLADELTESDQAKLQYLWNDKFNSHVEPILTKIPVCFQISKKFKKGPLFLNPTQRQAAAFQTEKFSALLAYGVGVGKTLASIVCFSQAFYNGYAKKGCFVVPTNTYDKWMGEIQGYTDKETGEYMHGALPQLPPIVGLFNLNPTIVMERLKVYTKEEQKQMDSVLSVIDRLKKMEVDVPSENQMKVLANIYPINWVGLRSAYSYYREETKATTPKTLTEFAADFLKEEYNYLIYALGAVREFPEGTIFITTEVGLQRLGIGAANKDELASKLYFILSQGEATAGVKDNRETAKLQLRIEQTISSSMKNAKLEVEELGIDWVCFDEAHLYKKIFTFVKGDITGETTDRSTGETKVKRDKSKYELKSGQYPSARALSAFVLSHFVQSKNNNRNVIQLTATPFTNSPLEVYSMLALTNLKAMEDMGVGNMVDFFDTFMKINYDIKYTPQKTVVKDVVLTGYNNLPQLRQIIYSLMDKKDEGASLKRPTKHIWPSVEKGIETTLPMTLEQEELMAEVKKYIAGDTAYEEICASALADDIENTDYDGLEDEVLISEWERATQKEYEGEREELSEGKREGLIKQIKASKATGMELGSGDLDEEESAGVRILKALSMMRQITLSPYLYYKACQKASGGVPSMPDYDDYVNSSPKFKYAMGCIASAMKWHQDNGTKAGGHVMYMNAGVEYFLLLKEYLVKKLRFKESQVGMVTGKMSKGAKENVKQAFLRGDILVLIGSSTISVGVDLQNNATTLYNLYYDWNPTDAAQIEGRIWRQGNRFANVRIMYPQCFNSADPVLFEYLNQKTLRINEIWNRSSEVQELDLRDFNPKELQKKLITDPEEKADWEILEESDKIEGEIIFAENRKETLSNAMYSFRKVNELRPKVKEYLTQIATRKIEHARKEAVSSQKDKISDLAEKYGDDPVKMADEISKYKKSRYDADKDPEGKYAVPEYESTDDEKLFSDAKKYVDQMQDWTHQDSQYGDLYYERHDIEAVLKEFRTNYKDMKAAEERVLKPMGLSFTTATDPINEFNTKIDGLRAQLDALHATKEDRVNRFKAEMAATRHQIKTIQNRVDEFAAANTDMIGPQLVLTHAQPAHAILPVNKDEIIVPQAEEKLAVKDKMIRPAEVKPEVQSEVQTKVQTTVETKPRSTKLKKGEIPPAKPAVKVKKEKKKEEVPLKPEPAAVVGKEAIEKQIKALETAKKFAADKEALEKQIKGLQVALKFAA